jgi:hemoglobin/transferrin/lactoferrin receptor protein
MKPFARTHLPLFAAALLPLTAHAAEPAQLGTVSVTAKGYAADDLETPLSTTSLDRAELLRRNAQPTRRSLRGEPGLAVASDGAQGQNPVIRGLKKESVVLLVDGMRVNSAQPQGAIASFMSLGLADRIEVVKGPASVLYGTGALGGAINLRCRRRALSRESALTPAPAYDSASSGLRGTGCANASQGDHALMLGAAVARIGDYSSPNGNVAKTGYDSDALIGQYRFRIDAAQQLRVSVQQQVDKDVWYPGSKKAHPVALAVPATPWCIRRDRSAAGEIGYSRKGSGASRP